MVEIVADDALALLHLYRWETAVPDRVALTQSIGGNVLLRQLARPYFQTGRHFFCIP
jgi:hypothetical protein